jgi:hypothetical protein
LADHRHLRQRLGADQYHREVSRRRIALVVVVIAYLLAIALAVALLWWSASPHASPAAISGPTAATPTTTLGACHSVNGLPDPICTPGAADPRVTQDNILTTICVSGYTTKVRPSSNYTNALKVQQIKEYGYTDTTLADYEEDHLIPLELGGHPTDPKNLWPEPLYGPYAATKKDGIENSLHNKVCDGLMTLHAAQSAIAANWESA